MLCFLTSKNNEAACLKARTDNEAVLLKAWQDTERIKCKADVADNLKLKFAKRKWDMQKKVIEIVIKQSHVEENLTLYDVEFERGLTYVRVVLEPPPLI